ncbi:MAG: hypothetical protein LBR55_05025 [Bacteroidales bacterium]|jgi:hypothetical protein|nr:hypothetical protein [Bacteroidales bacterium]
MKKITGILVSLLLTSSLMAQNYEDVLRTSETFSRGNARFMAMSGAMGALGNNMSALSINPAGGAIARTGMLEFTPAFSYIKSENYYLGTYNRRFETAFRLSNFGLMFAKNTPNGGIISGVSFGFTANNQNIYDASMRYEAVNNTSSFTDEALRMAEQNEVPENSYQDLFWQSYLLNNYDNAYFTDFRTPESSLYGQNQTAIINRSGGKYEYSFNFGLDFSQYIYVGADFSIQNINYNESFMVEERDRNNDFEYFNNFVYRSNLSVNGNGYMGKFGIIARPVEFIRLGVAYHTPTAFFLSEDYTQRINANFDKDISDDNSNITSTAASLPSNLYDYKIITPSKTVASLGLVYKNIAMLGIDYETVNYANAYLDAKDYGFSDENAGVSQSLARVDNLKIGAELCYGKYSVRLGTALYGNPYVAYKDEDTFYRTDISAGLGFKTEGFYCDLAWVKSAHKQYNFLYTDYEGYNVTGKSTLKKSDFTLTLGFKF